MLDRASDPASGCEPVVVGTGLVRDFTSGGRTLRAVRGVDIAVARGEIVAVVGESGCGKSTLARMLLGLLPPSAGEVRVAGRSAAGLGRKGLARLVQPVFQDPSAALNPAWTVGSIIRLPLDVHKIGRRRERAARVAALMEQVGLSAALASRTPRELSGGQRQRVAIARALIAAPQVLICDEPTSALDMSVQAQILNLLQDLQAEHRLGVVLITHNLGVVEHMADRVLVMYGGLVVEEGPAASLRSPSHPYTDRLRRAVLAPRIGTVLPADDAEEFTDPTDPPPGCAFHPRCPRRSVRCTEEVPLMHWRRDGRVACHHPLDLTVAVPSTQENAAA